MHMKDVQGQSEISVIRLGFLTRGASCCQFVAVGCQSGRKVEQLPPVTVLRWMFSHPPCQGTPYWPGCSVTQNSSNTNSV